MAISGTIITKFKTKARIRSSQRALGRAYREVAQDIENEMKTKSRAKQYPPASRPGQFPAERTGNFAHGINVTGTAKGITVASTMGYGKLLESGTSKMSPRPWAHRVLRQKKWETKIAKLAMKYTGGKAKTSKKGRR